MGRRNAPQLCIFVVICENFFGLCSSFLSLVLFICEIEWNEIVNLCINCSIYTVIELLYVCLEIHG